MANRKEKLSPKIEIINYFDSLINRVDMDIDECIENENYTDEQILSQLPCFQIDNRKFKSVRDFSLLLYKPFQSSQNNTFQWSESTKVIDYLNEIRKETIDELKKAQEDRIEHLRRLNSTLYKSISDDDFDLRSELFKERFYFQIIYKPFDPKYSVWWVFNLYTFVTDFYMSQADIDLLEYY